MEKGSGGRSPLDQSRFRATPASGAISETNHSLSRRSGPFAGFARGHHRIGSARQIRCRSLLSGGACARKNRSDLGWLHHLRPRRQFRSFEGRGAGGTVRRALCARGPLPSQVGTTSALAAMPSGVWFRPMRGKNSVVSTARPAVTARVTGYLLDQRAWSATMAPSPDAQDSNEGYQSSADAARSSDAHRSHRLGLWSSPAQRRRVASGSQPVPQNRVDPDTITPQFDRQRLGKPDHPPFRRGVM